MKILCCVLGKRRGVGAQQYQVQYYSLHGDKISIKIKTNEGFMMFLEKWYILLITQEYSFGLDNMDGGVPYHRQTSRSKCQITYPFKFTVETKK
jgi:hypothetical protein